MAFKRLPEILHRILFIDYQSVWIIGFSKTHQGIHIFPTISKVFIEKNLIPYLPAVSFCCFCKIQFREQRRSFAIGPRQFSLREVLSKPLSEGFFHVGPQGVPHIVFKSGIISRCIQPFPIFIKPCFRLYDEIRCIAVCRHMRIHRLIWNAFLCSICHMSVITIQPCCEIIWVCILVFTVCVNVREDSSIRDSILVQPVDKCIELSLIWCIFRAREYRRPHITVINNAFSYKLISKPVASNKGDVSISCECFDKLWICSGNAK